jgi:putative two-component system response regulator
MQHWDGLHELIMSHGQRVAQLAYHLARRSGQGHRASLRIAEAGYLHDLGKIALPDQILFKAEGLAPSERLLIETHTTVGFRFLSQIERKHRRDYSVAARVSLHHHERWDGRGYPLGLRAEAIPFEAQVVAVVDVFDALVTGRAYKSPWPADIAVDEIRAAAGKRFNPWLVELFAALFDDPHPREPIVESSDEHVALDVMAHRAFMSALLERGRYQ